MRTEDQELSSSFRYGPGDERKKLDSSRFIKLGLSVESFEPIGHSSNGQSASGFGNQRCGWDNYTHLFSRAPDGIFKKTYPANLLKHANVIIIWKLLKANALHLGKLGMRSIILQPWNKTSVLSFCLPKFSYKMRICIQLSINYSAHPVRKLSISRNH